MPVAYGIPTVAYLPEPTTRKSLKLLTNKALPHTKMKDFQKTYLVTGGTGFLGKPLIERLISQGHKVVTIARNEGKLLQLKWEFPQVKIFTGDCANKASLLKPFSLGIDGVFHLAAFKHVGMAEDQPMECYLSNAAASLNLLSLCWKYRPEFVIGISTDKAAQVAGVYGATKLLMERFFQEYAQLELAGFYKTRYRIVRYGNVLYSTGSVLTKWKTLLENGQKVIITDPNATRFFWTVDQAIQHIFDCLKNATSADPYIPEMKSMRILDLLTAMAKKYGNGKLHFKKIGLQPGENLHEKMSEVGPYSNEVDQYTIDEIMELI